MAARLNLTGDYDRENSAKAYLAVQHLRVVDRGPCRLCGTRHDVGCKHLVAQ